MKLYRFSPITTEEQLLVAIKYIHTTGNKLCLDIMGSIPDNAGNMGIFCHYEDEYEGLIAIRKNLTEPGNKPEQKYFRLHKPITFPQEGLIPETTYTHLYIRKPDPYRHQVGDLDFELPTAQYDKLKATLQKNPIKGARIFPRTDLDMIELHHPDIDILSYISTPQMTEAVHVNQGQSNL